MKILHENSTLSYKEQKEIGLCESYRRKIYDTILNSDRPLTDREIMDKLWESDVNNIRPEITRLKQDGLICECGKTKCRTTLKTVRTCVTTGLQYFDRKQNKKIKDSLF